MFQAPAAGAAPVGAKDHGASAEHHSLSNLPCAQTPHRPGAALCLCVSVTEALTRGLWCTLRWMFEGSCSWRGKKQFSLLFLLLSFGSGPVCCDVQVSESQHKLLATLSSRT